MQAQVRSRVGTRSSSSLPPGVWPFEQYAIAAQQRLPTHGIEARTSQRVISVGASAGSRQRASGSWQLVPRVGACEWNTRASRLAQAPKRSPMPVDGARSRERNGVSVLVWE